MNRPRAVAVLAVAAIAVAAVVAALAASPAVAGAATGGALDRSFSGDGRQTLDFGAGDRIEDLAIQADGKILAAGDRVRYIGGETVGDPHDIALARYRSDGRLDRRFGRRGRVRTSSGDLSGGAVAVQDNGRIVVASDIGPDFVLMRFLRGGAIDRDFGRRGKVRTDFGEDETALDVAIQDDGRIVVAGQSDGGFALARYLPDGSRDRSFSGDGRLTTAFVQGAADAAGVAVQSDGKLVAVGNADPPSADDDSDFALARYLPNGSLDPSFSGDGRQTTDFGGVYDFAEAVTIAGDRIVVAGQRVGNGRDFALASYHKADGSLDDGFSDDGRQVTEFGETGSDGARDVAVQDDGKVVAVGYTDPRGEPGRLALARYRAGGSLDPSFAGDGRQTTGFGGGRGPAGFGEAVALDAAGRIVAAGGRGRYGEGDFALARYRP